MAAAEQEAIAILKANDKHGHTLTKALLNILLDKIKHSAFKKA